jgi:hypothetical protein
MRDVERFAERRRRLRKLHPAARWRLSLRQGEESNRKRRR